MFSRMDSRYRKTNTLVWSSTRFSMSACKSSVRRTVFRTAMQMARLNKGGMREFRHYQCQPWEANEIQNKPKNVGI